ncbi:hypothetical protein H6G89_16475 [Oscillatoria sp. FACHB-1407]|uniref:hypothetical protein n=1 Tax=Oscillatoria sp. FACHB-1407 TaxID=2692847 RepID=UPI001682C2D4|nr:hypothetical protein [Oscillatoria sp. FACHB-1407]MBD2462637.1 hypothetical protein [Oscillatoria sp. FACHB-1407]
MSSSNPYQSRLFKFIVQQTRQLRDRSLQTWRQLRLGTIWGAQIALYPIYAAFQATRLAGKQLRQAVRQTTPRLKAAQRTVQTTLQRKARAPEVTPPIEVDAPVKQTLATVQTFALPVDIPGCDRSASSLPLNQGNLDGFEAARLLQAEGVKSQNNRILRELKKLADQFLRRGTDLELKSLNSPNLQTLEDSPKPSLQATPDQLATVQADPIRGIASLLTTRKLVLVTVQNQILDILTPEQDDYLRRRMIGAIASYLREWRQLAALQLSPFNALPPLAPRPNALPPVRSFCDLMRWMQYSPVAIAVNLFHEASLVPNHQRRTTTLETFHDPWEEVAAIPSLARFLQNSPQSRQSSSTDSAIELPVSSLPSGAELPLLSGSRRIVPTGTRAVTSVKTGSQSSVATRSGVLAQQTSLAPNAAPAAETLERVPLADIQIQPARPGETSSLQRSPEKGVIDIQASLVTYVKHPLQQVLEWIDQGMLWLEKQVIQLVNWLRRGG